MQYKNLGRTGLKVSRLCLGSMQMGWSAMEAEAHQILDAAFDAGINFIDTADIYTRWVEGNPGGVAEQIIGKWLKSGHTPRSQVILATKVYGRMGDGPNDEGLSRLHILQAVEDSLRRLQTDYIDLYQVHRSDENTPLEETLSALDQLMRQGKVRYIGCSNYLPGKLVEALWVSDRRALARFDSLQPHYNLVHRAEFESELRAVCKEFGIGVIPYSPLASGFLTGKYRRGNIEVDSQRKERASKYFSEQNWALLDLLDSIAAVHAPASVSQIALAWMLHDEVITSPIIGPRTLDQLRDNLSSLDITLEAEEVERLNQASASQ
ncbi:MAG: aldo/keto reductase [Anaerolineaceae bacterium]|nr:aldo/keto reductase [Anaerolineaceae bacterium]